MQDGGNWTQQSFAFKTRLVWHTGQRQLHVLSHIAAQVSSVNIYCKIECLELLTAVESPPLHRYWRKHAWARIKAVGKHGFIIFRPDRNDGKVQGRETCIRDRPDDERQIRRE